MTSQGNSKPGSTDLEVVEDEPDLARLGKLIRAYTPHEGSFQLHLPGVYAVRSSRPTEETVHHLQRPALCLVAQGAKRVMLGSEVYDYDASRMIVFSVDLPLAVRIIQASPEHPYLGLKIDLDPQRIAELVLKVYPHGLPRSQEGRGVCLARLEAGLVDAVARLLELMAHPGELELLAALVMDEILIRLLRSPIGWRVAQIGHSESGLHRVAKAVSWIRSNFSVPVNVEDLAGLVHMSPSSFHRQFKSVTSMSPLQYQKALRLQEARRLMATAMMDAGSAGRQVGYLSASQFSREYSRFFGSAPTRDMAGLREKGLAAADASS